MMKLQKQLFQNWSPDEIFQTIEELGFRRVTNKSQIILKESFEKYISEKYDEDLFLDLQSYLSTKLSDKDSFQEYEDRMELILDDSCSRNIMQGVFKTLKDVSKNRYTQKNFNELITEIKKQDVFDYIHNSKKSQNMILFFSTQKNKNEVLQEFFEPEFTDNAITGHFSHNKSEFPNREYMSYTSMVDQNGLNIKKIAAFFSRTYAKNKSNKPTKFACEDTGWIAKNGFSEEHKKVGELIEQKVIENSILLCCYNIFFMHEMQFKNILTAKDILIFDRPFCIYVHKDNIIN